MRFLLEWQHVAPRTRLAGLDGLAEAIGQLQGMEAPVAAWEESLLPGRVIGYQAALLDELCAHGEIAWGRPSLKATDPEKAPRRASATPSRATPITIARRDDLAWLLAAARGETLPLGPDAGAAAEVLEALGDRGALFFADLCDATGRLPTEIAEALWEGVARGLITADGFRAVRALLNGRYRSVESRPDRGRPGGPGRARPGFARPRPRSAGAHVPPALAGGRWSRLAAALPSDFVPDELAEAVAMQLLTRWGVVFRDLALRESLSISWRDVLWALRRLEARGIARGGRYVAGVSGEQYGLPEAVDQLRAIGRREHDATIVRIGAADPLNLTGILLPGPRIPAVRGHEIVLRDGAVLDDTAVARVATARPAAS